MDSETSQPSTELNTPAPPTKDQDNRRHSAEDHPCPTPETDHPTKPAPNQLHSRKIEVRHQAVPLEVADLCPVRPSQVIAYSPCHDGESAAPAGGATARSRATGRPNRRDRTIGRPPGECRRSSGTGCRENLIACRAVAVKSGHPFAKCIARRPLATTPASKSTTHGRRWLFGPQSIRLRQ